MPLNSFGSDDDHDDDKNGGAGDDDDRKGGDDDDYDDDEDNHGNDDLENHQSCEAEDQLKVIIEYSKIITTRRCLWLAPKHGYLNKRLHMRSGHPPQIST